MTYSLLEIGREYELEVFKIKEAEGSYVATLKGGIKMFCHGFYLVDKFDDSKQYRCQICDESHTQEYCQVKDIITIKAKAFTGGKHTIEIVRNDSINRYPEVMHSAKEYTSKMVDGNPNPIIGSTAAAIALTSAVNFWTTRECPDGNEAITATAEHFFEFLISKHNPNPNPF